MSGDARPGQDPRSVVADRGSWPGGEATVIVGFPSSSPITAPEGSVYKEFAIEAVVWLIPVVILIGLAIMITQPA
ncbi:hypothetical protein GCM10010517_25690 [Streptosporangium fragile]|uniref:Uncharacterized protein n=1 Tax=Streptosporangium fragile TaxID=46186 RepID=A0ABN3VW61_9ACTN